MHSKFRQVLLVIGLSLTISLPTLLRADIAGPRILGIVEKITEDGFLTINVPKTHGGGFRTIDPWATEIDPRVLELVTLNRRVSCLILGEESDVIRGSCLIWPTSLPWDQDTGERKFKGRSLFLYLPRLGLAEKKCSAEEQRFEKTVDNIPYAFHCGNL